jgi:hypothetical protein
MDPIWKQLPDELANHICNKLPQVRSIPADLKESIVTEQWRITRFAKYWTTNRWIHAFNVLCTHIEYHTDIEEYIVEMDEGYEWATRSLWGALTNEEKDQFELRMENLGYF